MTINFLFNKIHLPCLLFTYLFITNTIDIYGINSYIDAYDPKLQTEKDLSEALTLILAPFLKNNEQGELEVFNPDTDPYSISKFYGKSGKLPSVSMLVYMQRLVTYFRCSRACFILALIYIDRFTVRLWSTPEYKKLHPVNNFTIHRIFLAALVVAVKFIDDVFFTNTYYARVGGIDQQELKMLEIQFLSIIQFNLFVCKKEWISYDSVVASCELNLRMTRSNNHCAI